MEMFIISLFICFLLVVVVVVFFFVGGGGGVPAGVIEWDLCLSFFC